MTAIDRLQDLLGRVQRNRRASGAPHAPAPPMARAGASAAIRDSLPAALDPEVLAQDEFPLEPERGSIPISLDPTSSPPPAVQVPRAAAVPYEARMSRPQPVPDAYAPAEFGDLAESPRSAPPEPEHASFGQSYEERLGEFPPAEGSVITAPPVPQPTRPIAQVVSRHPPVEPLTFGKLLGRSLSLRAR